MSCTSCADHKKLSLIQIQNMSMNDIISLYRQGFKLEETSNIKSMQTVSTLASKPSPCPPLGDVDGDGLVSTTDANWIAQYTVGTRTLTPEQLIRADVNGDGKVNIVDSLIISQYLAGTINTFPGCASKPCVIPVSSLTI